MTEEMKQKRDENPQIRHLKKISKIIRKAHPEISLMRIQHIVARKLGFVKWEELRLCSEKELQLRIDSVDFENEEIL